MKAKVPRCDLRPPNHHYWLFFLVLSVLNTMAASALDSRVFRNLFGTQEVRNLFTDEAYVQHMIDVEAALARAQSKCGLIPDGAGSAITEAFKSINVE